MIDKCTGNAKVVNLQVSDNAQSKDNQKTDMENIKLFSAWVCPFAHRSRLALAEKGLPFELVEIDLRNKPSWYKEINPAEAVPALQQGNFLLQESLIINECIEELTNNPSLLPATPQQRAEARLWISYADAHFVPLFYRLLKAVDEDKRKTASDAMLSVLTVLNKELHRRKEGGPYWFGEQVGLTDIAIYPWI